MRKMTLIIGGPAYNMQVDARHASAMVELSLKALLSGQVESVNTLYEHGCPVEMARNSLFRKALSEKDATHLITADSDVYWENSEELIWGCHYIWGYNMNGELVTPQPLMGIPVLQRNGAANILENEGSSDRLHGRIRVGRGPRYCFAVGTGLCLYNLDWYRVHWPEGPWFRTDWFDIFGNGRDIFVSEDFWHCLELRRFVVKPLWAPLVRTWHAARGMDDGAAP